MSVKLAIVTGGNKGIGEAIVRHLAKRYKAKEDNNTTQLRIYLTARDTDRGQEALTRIQKELKDAKNPIQTEVAFHQLDVTNQPSIDTFAKYILDNYGKRSIRILFNNAGISMKDPSSDKEIARKTIDTNYFGMKNVSLALLPLFDTGARLINMSSSVGALSIVSPELQKEYTRPDLTLDQLDALQENYVKTIGDNTFKDAGYPKNSYGVSKLGVKALTKILDREYKNDPRKIFFASLCPGWVKTDLTGNKGNLTTDEGVQTPVYLALSDEDRVVSNSGEFWTRKTIDMW